MALTDKEIQALKPREKRYKVTDGDGLYLRDCDQALDWLDTTVR